MDLALIILLFGGFVSIAGTWLEYWSDGKPKDAINSKIFRKKLLIKVVTTIFLFIAFALSYINLLHERAATIEKRKADSTNSAILRDSHDSLLKAGGYINLIKAKTDSIIDSLNTVNRIISSSSAATLKNLSTLGKIATNLGEKATKAQYPFSKNNRVDIWIDFYIQVSGQIC